MVYGIEITPCARQLPRYGLRVLVWSGRGKRGWRWKPGTWEPQPSGGCRAGFYLDCGTGPVEVTHWCNFPPEPDDA